MGSEAHFTIGQTVHHRLFDYRGVIYDVDPVFLGSDAWYEQVARTRPPKDEPWYRVLVDGDGHETYVAQRNLEPDLTGAPIRHHLTNHFFSDFRDGAYLPRRRTN